MTSTMTIPNSRADLLELWRASFVLDGYSDPKESALEELSRYFHISRDEALARCENWEQDSIAEWEAKPRDTDEALLDFYRSQQSWIFDTIWYHAQQYTQEVVAESVMIAERLAQMGVKPEGKALDFGAGPGSTSLFFHKLGWDVALADISTPLQEFARWRLEQRGIAADYYDTSRVSLPSEAFDVITACDVMVHVPHPKQTLQELHRALKPGGLLFFNVDARPKPSRETQWHLYPYAYPVLRPVRAMGFAAEPQLEFFHVYRKLPTNSPLRERVVTILDTCRYNIVVSKLGEVVRAARARQ